MTEQRKVVFVTGGSSGIGQGIALVFAEKGYDVAITYKTNAAGGMKTKEAVEKLGRRCEVYQATMEDLHVPSAVVDRVHRDFGRLDVMVCNANRDRRNSVLTITPELIDEMMKSNFASYVLCAGAAARHMVKDGIKGTILFITSTHGYRAYQDDVLYGGLKAGIMRASESMAIDLAPYGIRVNCIAPGATKVRETPPDYHPKYPLADVPPLKRFGTPRENGELAYFLASDSGSYITGTTVKVDGGLILSGPPEAWAPAYINNPDWTKKHYEEAMRMLEKEEDTDA